MISKKKKPITIKDSGLEIVRTFKLPLPVEHVPTITRVKDSAFSEAEFMFYKERVFQQKGESKSGIDVFLTDHVPNRGNRLDVNYIWYDEKWRRFSRHFRVYIDRSKPEIVL